MVRRKSTWMSLLGTLIAGAATYGIYRRQSSRRNGFQQLLQTIRSKM